MSRSKTKTPKKKARPLTNRILARMAEAEWLLEHGNIGRACEVLEDLRRHHPRSADVLRALVDVYHRAEDIRSLQSVAQQLLDLDPNDPDLYLMLAGCYLSNVLPALSIQTFDRFLDRWPDDPRADDVRRTVDDLRLPMAEQFERLGLAGEDCWELAAMHDEVLCLLREGKYARVRAVAGQLLERRPGFLPALNNIAEAHFQEGHFEQAVRAARQVLEVEPDNFHGLGNLARYLFLSGAPEEAAEWVERLKKVETDHMDVWAKKVEALGCLGDDRGVLEAFEEARTSKGFNQYPGNALVYHGAAVAEMNRDRTSRARKYWKKALQLDPGFQPARLNLSDLKRPISERHAPWMFEMAHWIPAPQLKAYHSHLKPVARADDERSVARRVGRYLEKHPNIGALIPVLLERGDPEGRQFALDIARLAETPPMQEALKTFALGRRGPDELRIMAAQTLARAGVLPTESVSMWVDGTWRELLLLEFDLHGEPIHEHSPRIAPLVEEAVYALNAQNGDRAERLLLEALEIEPDNPTLLNNLSVAYTLLDRHADADQIASRLSDEHPDYLFGRVNMARICMRNGDSARARELLAPLRTRGRYHFSEFNALCLAHVELCWAEGKPEAAQAWFRAWEESVEENHAMRKWRRQLTSNPLHRLLDRKKG